MLVAAACGSDGGVAADTNPTAPSTAADTTPTAPSTAAGATTTTATATTVPPDLEVFIAALDESLEGTSYEGAPLEDPEVFIGVGQHFCELLAEGLTVDEVLTEYLTALEKPDGGVSEDDTFVSGIVMGASLEILCPEHDETA